MNIPLILKLLFLRASCIKGLDVLKVSHLILFFKIGQKLKHRLVQAESKI